MSAIPSPWDSPAGSPSFGARVWIGVVDTGGGVYAVRAQLQTADDAAGTSWTPAGDLVAPDVSGDPSAVAATFSASGLEIPAGPATGNATLAQYWGWNLIGGGLALGLDPSRVLELDMPLSVTATGGPNLAAALCLSGASTPGVGGYTSGIRLPVGAQSSLYAQGASAWLYSGSSIDGVLGSVLVATDFRTARTARFNGTTYDGTATQTPTGAASTLYLHLLAIRTSIMALPGTISFDGAVQWAQMG